MEQHSQVLDVREAVSAVLLTLEPQLSAKRLDSIGDVPPDIRAVAEPDKLRRILLTLLTNAIRFSNPGGYVMVDVGYPLEMPDDVVMIRVGDGGRGISREMQRDIFEPPASGEQRASDAGPGLPACRAWARAMGGDLRVRSDEGKGSVFTLTLPRARDAG